MIQNDVDNILHTKQRWLHYFLYVLGLLFILILSNSVYARDSGVILVYGDSLSAAYGMQAKQGWASLMQEQINKQKFPYRIVNASISGETTGGGLARFANTLKSHQPQWVILELGANDGLRGLPVAQMQENLQKMIQLSKQAHAKVILLGMMIPPNYGPRYTQAFKQVFPQLATQEKVALIPFFLQDVAGKPEYLQADGLHPNEIAQPVIMQTVWKTLQPALSSKHSPN